MLTAAFAASLTATDLPAQIVTPVPPAGIVAPAGPPTPADPVAAVPAPDTAAPPPVETPTKPEAMAPASAGSREIIVSGKHGLSKIDPVEGVNKVSFEALESVDKAVIGPIMHIYRDGIPRPVRQGLHNFFFNLYEPVNAINYVLQLHPGKALKTMARFGINSTVGVGGLIDVAKKKPFNLHYRPNGFGNTMGYWGIGPGPFLFLPLVGPTSVRDLIGSLLDQVPLPLLIKPLKNIYFVTVAGVITELDYRVDIDAGVERVRKSNNVYASYRQAYFRSRFEEIEALHGRGPLARGEVGQPPFVQPLYPEAAPALPTPSAPGGLVPAAPVAAPPAAALSLPAMSPLPPVFIATPVIQLLPVVQPLPLGYRPGGS